MLFIFRILPIPTQQPRYGHKRRKQRAQQFENSYHTEFITAVKEKLILQTAETERRKHPRQAYSEKLKFALTLHTSSQVIQCASINISVSGMSIYTFDRLVEGDTVEIDQDLPVPYRKAIVKWASNHKGYFYKAGLKLNNYLLSCS